MSSACGCVSFKETPLALTLFWDFQRSQVCFMPGSCFALSQWHLWAGSRGAMDCICVSLGIWRGSYSSLRPHLAQVMLVLLFVRLYKWNESMTVSSRKLPLKKQKQNSVFNLDVLTDYFISWFHEHLNYTTKRTEKWASGDAYMTWPLRNRHV